jgi:hypothetical protein
VIDEVDDAARRRPDGQECGTCAATSSAASRAACAATCARRRLRGCERAGVDAYSDSRAEQQPRIDIDGQAAIAGRRRSRFLLRWSWRRFCRKETKEKRAPAVLGGAAALLGHDGEEGDQAQEKEMDAERQR